MAASAKSRHDAQLSLAAEILRASGEVRLTAFGSSMVPSIFPGDVLTIRRQQSSSVRCGDVVLCTRGDRFVVHRVVRELSTSSTVGWVTRGDALDRDDPPVAEGELLGRVIAIERDGNTWAPARPSMMAQAATWAVRRSGTLLRFLLHAHAVRGRSAQRLVSTANLRATRCL